MTLLEKRLGYWVVGLGVELWGHAAKAVHDGAAAAELRPEVILLDIGLPGIDGYEVARRLRAAGLGGKLLVAMTGSAATAGAWARPASSPSMAAEPPQSISGVQLQRPP